MTTAAQLGRFSLGVGDRFGHQAAAQLRAVQQAKERGIAVTPVWNKSYREHSIIGTHSSTVRDAADKAVAELNWALPYFVDADHINLKTVDLFVEACDFFTIDVASCIDQSTDEPAVEEFASRHPELSRVIEIEGLGEPIRGTPETFRRAADRFLGAAMEAGRIYRHVRAAKGESHFLTEVSMDETAKPQTAYELIVILAALADEGVCLATIAPRFCGRFNKGVDYVGDVEKFEREFAATVAVVRHAVTAYSLPESLMLSLHSGSDKFSIYPAVRRVLHKTGAGVHVKTAGTTWLEELIGLAEAGGETLAVAKEIYQKAFLQREALCLPYADVIDIDPLRLPLPDQVDSWSSTQYAESLRHDIRNASYNPHFRQLLHVGYKCAAQLGSRYFEALESVASQISRNVTVNLLDRHIVPLFSPEGR